MDRISRIRQFFILLSLTTSLLFLGGCGQQNDQNSTIVVISSKVLAFSTQAGGVMLYAQEVGTTNTSRLAVQLQNSANTTLTLNNGTWNFFSIGWTGTNALEGDVRCGKVTQNLTGGQSSLAIDLTQSQCTGDFFGSSAYVLNNQFLPLKVHSCNTLSSITSGSQNCAAPNMGGAQSFRMALLSFTLSPNGQMLGVKEVLESKCYNFQPTNASAALNPYVETGIKLPTGKSESFFPAVLRFYGDTNCSGTVTSFNIEKNISTNATGLLKLVTGGSGFTNLYGQNTSYTPGLSNIVLEVKPLYPNNGAKWNDYVKNDGTNMQSASDTACVGTETGKFGCVHGGDLRQVTLTGVTSCTGLTMTDSLSAFKWNCAIKNGVAVFIGELGSGISLANLVSGTSWINNHVTLTKGSQTFSSTSGAWWTNTVTALPDNSSAVVATDLSTASTIYTLTTSRNTKGYNLAADKVAIITLNGSELTYNGDTATNCNLSTGESSSPNSTCMIAAGSQKYLWIEAYLIGSASNSAKHGIYFYNVAYSRTFNTNVNKFGQIGVELASSQSNIFSNIRLQNNGSGGHGSEKAFALSSTNYSFIIESIIGNNVGPGISFVNSGHNAFYKFKSFNNSSEGVKIDYGCNSNALISGFTSNNASAGIEFASTSTASSSNTLVDITTSFNGQAGLQINGPNANRNTILKLVAFNNTGSGIVLNTPTHLTLANIVSAHNGVSSEYQLTRGGSGNNNMKYSGNVLLGTTAGGACDTYGSATSPGMNNSCASQDVSDHTYVSTSTMSSTFVGRVTTDDTTSPSDSSGSASTLTGLNWVLFSNAYRFWGKDGASSIASTQRGRWVSSTGRIWDLSLSSSDTILLNRTGNGSSANDTFTAGATCPSQVHGNKTTTDQMSTANTFLLSATENIDSLKGDGDGLCESSESCIYTPNFGAYQGNGDHEGNGCTFNANGGSVTNVTMTARTNNGN